MILDKIKQLKDQDIEIVMGKLLRIGVVLSAFIVAVGELLILIRTGFSTKNYGIFKGEPERLKDLNKIFIGALSFHGQAIIQLGLVLLIATPIARVTFSVIAFIAEKDRFYAFVTIFVLFVLLFSINGGI